jgi:hypothetical protein
MSYLLSLSSRLKKNPPPAPAAAPVPVIQTVAVPVVESFLSVSESVEVAPLSTFEADPELAVEIPIVEEETIEEPSEEQCASPLAPASIASSHTE